MGNMVEWRRRKTVPYSVKIGISLRSKSLHSLQINSASIGNILVYVSSSFRDNLPTRVFKGSQNGKCLQYVGILSFPKIFHPKRKKTQRFLFLFRGLYGCKPDAKNKKAAQIAPPRSAKNVGSQDDCDLKPNRDRHKF
jgi:hypothetical protein